MTYTNLGFARLAWWPMVVQPFDNRQSTFDNSPMWATGAYGHLSDYLWWWFILASLLIHTWCFFRLFSRARSPRLRLILGNALVASCMLVFAGLVAESYLRFVSLELDSFGVTLTAKRWMKVYPKLNSLLFRDEEWTPQKPPGTRRIAFVGDSFVYGWGIEKVDDRFTNLIQKKFDEQNRGRAEVMNVAWVAWDTRKELGGIHDIIDEYDVDEIILCYLPNDIEPLLTTTAYFNPTQSPKNSYINTDSSFLLDFLHHRIAARRQAGVRNYFDWLWEGYNDPKIWHEQQTLLGSIINLCKDRNRDLRVILFPFLMTWGEQYKQPVIHARLREFFERNQTPVLNLLPVLEGHDPKALIVNSHDPHPNEEANRIFADVIWTTFFQNE